MSGSGFDLFSGQEFLAGSHWHFKILRHFKLSALLCIKKHSPKSQGETVNIVRLFVGFIGAKSIINQSNKPII